MTIESTTDAGTDAADGFERDLRTLVLESFAEGAAVQGTWDISASSSFVPDWRVTIEKVDDADLPEDNEVFLDD